ncbi:oxidoreductase [Yoonia sp.]|uniref:oxidoreductase n=1 Tax=Yoonia sp. TaxID=2212373 RepID=UPI002FDB08E1
MRKRVQLTGLLGLWLLGSLAGPAAAEDPVLTVAVLEAEHALTLDNLREMDQESFETTTIWTEGVQTFSGVPLWVLVARYGITDGELIATAINDYAISFPVQDALQQGPIVAFLRNGKEMSVRDKGPLWIVYPYDSSEAFQTEIVHARSIWQLNRITIRAD